MVRVLLFMYSFKWQYMAEAGTGAEIMDKGGAETEPEPKINNFCSAKHCLLLKGF